WTVMGWVLARRRGRAPGHFGGWITQTPRLALVFLVSLLGLAAFPGLGLFGGFYLVLLSVYRASPVLGLAAVGAFVISAWPLALLFKKIFLGPPPAGTPARVPDLGVREALVFLPLFLASVWIGVGPNQFLQPMEKSVQLNVLQRLNALPAMMDFAAYQRMLQDERQKAGKPPAGP
ncbi:MAG TPA: hypothetical protein VFR02_09030, partial [bacterium]|nr:hypothetical protein [bacterium]